MSFQPLFACGNPLILLFVFAPAMNCALVFIAGAVCSKMGNKDLGGWIMAISGFFGAASCVMASATL